MGFSHTIFFQKFIQVTQVPEGDRQQPDQLNGSKLLSNSQLTRSFQLSVAASEAIIEVRSWRALAWRFEIFEKPFCISFN